ncbi:glycan-binding surface protein [Pontibacter harenae]|uniref:glycan-binding surface protein n=1 Tax=Pontibacter harenae TaxID=2894083 RepID=UPI001E39B997|nr:glycan-binding surface protein [Pontibacter harenae]MCC9166997.1 glycan-binding surface protein [Pontibacter harenae]
MKFSFKSILFFFIAVAMVGMFSSCTEDEELPYGGKPTINYIRITNPDASDSLVAKAGQGAMIAIVGQNLEGAREIWFNDLRGSLSPTFITNTSIITRVPADIPTEISNQIKIIFADGDSLMYDFEVDISEPVITGMLSEYVNTGDVATIYGNFFYDPVTVTFTGGVEGEVVSVSEDANVIEVIVPEGAVPGPITVSTNFGEFESEFWFRDNRNIIAGFDGTLAGLWTGPDYVKASDPVIPAINGKFVRFNKSLGPYPYSEFYVGPANSDLALENRNIPEDALANPADYVLKFEVNTLAPLAGAELRMYIGNGDLVSERDAQFYTWRPNVNTNGRWETVSIPFEDFYTANEEFAYNPNGYNMSFWFHGPVAVNTNFAMDNLRVVPIAE